MPTGQTGSERSYPNQKNASNKDGWGGPGGRSYPAKRAQVSDASVKSRTVGADAMPPGPGKPSTSVDTEYRQKGSSREYAK